MSRLENIRNEMKRADIDALFVTNEINQHYISEFEFQDGMLLITHQNAYLITDFRYYEMALNDADRAFDVVTPKGKRFEFLLDCLKKEKIGKIGFEGNSLSFAEYTAFKEYFSDYELVSVGDMLDLARQIKDDDELSYMQKAQDIADSALSHVLKMITPNMTEIEVAAEIEYAIRRGGADGVSFGTIAVSGDASALPHGTPRNVKLRKGFLTMDFGAKYKGYCSDMTRTVSIGKADDAMRKLYNTVLSAQLAAIDFLREGVDAGEADKVARDIIDANPEYRGAFGHSLGHSVGLLVHETPTLSPKSFGRKLRVGEILTVEPGIYLFGKYGCRIEDMVKIEKLGVYNFTNSPKELIEIY
jgi:Xaa-Pro aminopeptidase